MKILFYLHQFPAIGGIETVTATLANFFVANGHTVGIASFVKKDNARETVSLDGRVNLYCGENVRQVVKKEKIDVVIFQDSYERIEHLLFPCEARVITVEHNTPYSMMRFGFGDKPWFYRLAWHIRHPFLQMRMDRKELRRHRFLYDKSDVYCLLSNRFFGEFRALCKLEDSRKLYAIPNPISPSLIRSPARKENIVLFCGTLDVRKGCDLLLKSWRLVNLRNDSWQLVIVGDGPERERLERDARDITNVSFVGYKTDPSEYFAKAKILALPSRREGWALVLSEAMSNGCVPVAFESYAAVRDIIDEGKSGYIVPAFDTEYFANALLSLMDNVSMWCALSNSAIEQANRYSIDEVGGAWLKLLGNLGRGENV